nr:unnamed protein product [Spirometra erinaceieuropaei]
MQSTRAGITDLGRMAQEAEAQRDAQHQMTFEARKILNEEKERQRQQEEATDNGSCPRDENYQGYAESISSRFSSRQSSLDPTFTSNSYYSSDARELRRQLRQLEEKYKEVMVVNAQLDGDKQLLSYTVDLLKDKIEDLTESNQYNQRCANERKKDLAYQRMQIAELTHQLNSARHQIEQRDELLEERGLVLVDAYQMHPAASSSSTTGATESGSSVDGAYPNGDSASHRLQNGADGATTPSSSNEDPTATDQRKSAGLTLLSKDNAEHLLKTPGFDMDSKLAFLFAEQAKAQDKISRLQSHLEEERERVELVQKIDARAAYKGSDPDSLRQNMQTARSQALDYKFRLEQATQKITALEGDIIRLESQVKRFKTNLEDAEKKEEQLKQDRRKLQRDVREANILIDELKSENSTLQRKVDKLTRGTVAGSNLRSGSASRTLRDSSQSR